MVAYVRKIRDKANLVKDPALRAKLGNVKVEVFSDLPKPKRGEFWELIKDELIDWKPIPRGAAKATTRQTAKSAAASAGVVGSSRSASVSSPNLGTLANIALGVVISLAEAGVANAAYQDSVEAMQNLLKQIEVNGDADEEGWREIESKLQEIAVMKQSMLGRVWEWLTYGQGSLTERKAMAIMTYSSELATKYGYRSTRGLAMFSPVRPNGSKRRDRQGSIGSHSSIIPGES